MNATTLARLQGAARLVIGTAHVLQPDRAAAAWVGADAERPGTQVFAGAFGARDAALGAGALATAGSSAARPWLLAGVVSDAVDLVATLRGRDGIPKTAVVGVSIIAAGSAALGLYLATQA